MWFVRLNQIEYCDYFVDVIGDEPVKRLHKRDNVNNFLLVEVKAKPHT